MTNIQQHLTFFILLFLYLFTHVIGVFVSEICICNVSFSSSSYVALDEIGMIKNDKVGWICKKWVMSWSLQSSRLLQCVVLQKLTNVLEGNEHTSEMLINFYEMEYFNALSKHVLGDSKII
jgi:hypothetical protein